MKKVEMNVTIVISNREFTRPVKMFYNSEKVVGVINEMGFVWEPKKYPRPIISKRALNTEKNQLLVKMFLMQVKANLAKGINPEIAITSENHVVINPVKEEMPVVGAVEIDSDYESVIYGN